jgi:UDP-glucose 4-epimerase
MVIPRFVQAALEGKPINIFGDGSQSRVFCHVYDATKATNILALDSKSIGEVFNIGGVGEISILDLANNIIQQLNSNSKIIFTAYEEAYKVGYEDMQRRVPNISKISSFNGWKPNLSLNSIIKDVANSLTSKA